MKMPDAKMMVGLKIGQLLFKAMRGNAQEAALEVLDDFGSSEKKDDLMDRLANYLMCRYKATEVDIGSTEEGLEVTLVGGENVLEKMTGDIEGLIQQTRMFIPDETIRDKFMELVEIEEEGDKTTLKLKIEDEVVKAKLREVL